MAPNVKLPSKIDDLHAGSLRAQYLEIIDFLITVRQLNVSNNIEQLKTRLLKMFLFMQKRGYTDAKDFQCKDFMDYMGTMSSGMARSTWRWHMDSCRHTAEWLYYTGLHTSEEIIYKLRLIRAPKKKAMPPGRIVAFSDRELHAIFQHIDSRWPYDIGAVDRFRRGRAVDMRLVMKSIKNLQTKTLILLMLESGARIEGAWNLKVDDVDPINEAFILDEKNGDRREVPYSDMLRKQFKVFLSHRALVADPKEKRIWIDCTPAKFGQAIDSRRTLQVKLMESIRLGLKMYDSNGKEIPIKVNWHKFRKTFATRCYEEGLDVGVISKLLGHRDTATTMIYIGIDQQRVLNECRAIEAGRSQRYEHAIGGILGDLADDMGMEGQVDDAPGDTA